MTPFNEGEALPLHVRPWHSDDPHPLASFISHRPRGKKTCRAGVQLHNVTAVQSEVNKVYDWSEMSKLNLNEDKNECYPFSTWFNDSKWRPSLTIGWQQIRVNDTPRLLSVILDRSLSFNARIKHIKQSLSWNFEQLQLLHMLTWVSGNLYC